jgi:hypothetical protein
MTLKKWDKKVKKLDSMDVGLIKWTTVASVLVILSAWDAARYWVADTHWGWFLAVAIILALRPMKKWLK